MKRYLLALPTLLLALSCNKAPIDRVNRPDMRAFFVSELKNVDSTGTLETFDVWRIDTITQQQQYLDLMRRIGYEQDYNHSQIDYFIETAKQHEKMRALAVDVDYTLASNYQSDKDSDIKKAKDLLKKDSLLLADRKAINQLALKADSTKPVAYLAYCPYSYKKANRSVVKDTGSIVLDLDYNIVDNPEYNKRLIRLHRFISDFSL